MSPEPATTTESSKHVPPNGLVFSVDFPELWQLVSQIMTLLGARVHRKRLSFGPHAVGSVMSINASGVWCEVLWDNGERGPCLVSALDSTAPGQLRLVTPTTDRGAMPVNKARHQRRMGKVAELVKAQIRSKGLTQAAIAAELGISIMTFRQTVFVAEGTPRDPYRISRISEVLGWPREWLDGLISGEIPLDADPGKHTEPLPTDVPAAKVRTPTLHKRREAPEPPTARPGSLRYDIDKTARDLHARCAQQEREIVGLKQDIAYLMEQLGVASRKAG